MSLWISLSAFFYLYDHFSLKVFMKLYHGRSKYQKRHFCVSYMYFWFIYSATPCLIIILTIPHQAQYQPQFARISYKLPGCHTQVKIYSMPEVVAVLSSHNSHLSCIWIHSSLCSSFLFFHGIEYIFFDGFHGIGLSIHGIELSFAMVGFQLFFHGIEFSFEFNVLLLEGLHFLVESC